MKKTIISTLIILCTLLIAGCKADNVEVAGGSYHFAEQSYSFGVLSNEEWFEVPVIATLPHSEARNIGIEVVASESSAIEGVHFSLESHTLPLKADSNEAVVRIQGNPEAFELGEILTLKLRLAVDDKYTDDTTTAECEIELQKCCPFDINAFTGYCKITSTYFMQYLNCDARLVRTERDPENENGIVIKDMFYEGHDVHFTLHSDDPLNPIADMPTTVVGSTGEAFGTIYGNGKLMISEPEGEGIDSEMYKSYYGMCERFLFNYAMLYVEEVGIVGVFVNIFEWISDDEAERIMREGF